MSVTVGFNVAGVTMPARDGRDRQAFLRKALKERVRDLVVMLKAEPDNPYDPNAVGVWMILPDSEYCQIGYVPKRDAEPISQDLKEGMVEEVEVFEVGEMERVDEGDSVVWVQIEVKIKEPV